MRHLPRMLIKWREGIEAVECCAYQNADERDLVELEVVWPGFALSSH